MRTYFYKGTAFELTAARVPRCFVDLDKHLGRSIPTERAGLEHRGRQLAEILCGRLADVAFFGEAIPKALSRRNPFNAGIHARTLLVGHFGACKAVLDAGAITLAELYRLGQGRKDGLLTEGQIDFRQKGPFRGTLKAEQRPVYDRYKPFFATVEEIVEWRNAAVHRVPPLIMMQSPEHPATVARDRLAFRLILRPDGAIPTDPVHWHEHASPLHFHERWYPQLVAFCGEVCQDLRSHSSVWAMS